MKITHDGHVFKALLDKPTDAPTLDKKGWWPGLREFGSRLVWWTKDAWKVKDDLIPLCDESALAILAADKTLDRSRSTSTTWDIPRPAGLNYLPYQGAGVEYMYHKPKGLLADEMGLGKTIQALGLMNILKEEAQDVLIVCPATLKLNWAREALKWLIKRPFIYIVDSNLPVPTMARFVIVNYDMLWKDKIHASLMARDFHLQVWDEAHALKSLATKRSKAALGYYDTERKSHIQGIADRCKRLWFLTGTPILNRPFEIFPLLNKIDPVKFARPRLFMARYCGGSEKGAHNLDELQNVLRAHCMVRRMKVDVLKELPPKRRQLIISEPNAEARAIAKEEWDLVREYKAQKGEMQKFAATKPADAGNNDAYAAQVAKMRESMMGTLARISIIRHKFAIAKAPMVAAHILECLDSGSGKIVCFAHHKDVLYTIAELLKAGKQRSVIINGDVSLPDRQRAVDTFQTDPGCTVFLGNIKAAGVGITLTASNHVVFAELDWTPANMTQAEDRTHRIGQLNSVLVQHILMDDTLDQKMSEKLVAKQEIIDQALGRPLTEQEAAPLALDDAMEVYTR